MKANDFCDTLRDMLRKLALDNQDHKDKKNKVLIYYDIPLSLEYNQVHFLAWILMVHMKKFQVVIGH